MSYNDWTNNFLDSFEDELLPEIEELEPVEASDNHEMSPPNNRKETADPVVTTALSRSDQTALAGTVG